MLCRVAWSAQAGPRKGLRETWITCVFGSETVEPLPCVFRDRAMALWCAPLGWLEWEGDG
jgi:hypothetical protein